MKSSNIRFDQQGKIALALLTPLLFMIPLVVLFVTVRDAPDWLIIIAIVVVIISALISVVVLVKKLSSEIVFHDEENGKYRVEFTKRGFFAPHSFDFELKDIGNFWTDLNQTGFYASFDLHKPPFSFQLCALTKNEEDQVAFINLMNEFQQAVNQFNVDEVTAETKELPIASVTMYETWWAKALSLIVILVVIGIVGVSVYTGQEVPWYKFTLLIILGVPFIGKVYSLNYGKGRKK